MECALNAFITTTAPNRETLQLPANEGRTHPTDETLIQKANRASLEIKFNGCLVVPGLTKGVDSTGVNPLYEVSRGPSCEKHRCGS